MWLIVSKWNKNKINGIEGRRDAPVDLVESPNPWRLAQRLGFSYTLTPPLLQ
jgi:hypothetical protein